MALMSTACRCTSQPAWVLVDHRHTPLRSKFGAAGRQGPVSFTERWDERPQSGVMDL